MARPWCGSCCRFPTGRATSRSRCWGGWRSCCASGWAGPRRGRGGGTSRGRSARRARTSRGMGARGSGSRTSCPSPATGRGSRRRRDRAGRGGSAVGCAAMSMIDLRSDTVTRPTAAMRKAMADAEVGDDVYRDDPTVLALEARVAELLGTEAALFMPTGTMANQVAIRAHTQPGDEIIIAKDAHCWRSESGALAALVGVQTSMMPDYAFTGADVRAACKSGDDPHLSLTRVV